MTRLVETIALITGSASGIGLACAERFALEGATVVGLDLSEPSADEWAAVAEASPDSEFATGDVRDEARIAALVEQTVEKFGRIDVVVNAAGVAGGGAVHTIPTDEWDRVLDINLKGTFLVCKYALAKMVEQGSGAIVNIASIEGLEASEGGGAYNASKGGVVLLTKNMAMDYGRRGIRVNCVCPGFIDTPLLRSVFDGAEMKPYLDKIADMHQLGRLGRPEEIAAAALFLAGDDASFVTGHALSVDGGYTAGKRIGFGKLMGLD